MPHELIDIITSDDPDTRNLSLDAYCRAATVQQLLGACDELDRFRRHCDNLYQRVRALFFLSTIYRYHLPDKLPAGSVSRVPYDGFVHLLSRSQARAGQRHDQQCAGRGLS